LGYFLSLLLFCRLGNEQKEKYANLKRTFISKIVWLFAATSENRIAKYCALTKKGYDK